MLLVMATPQSSYSIIEVAVAHPTTASFQLNVESQRLYVRPSPNCRTYTHGGVAASRRVPTTPKPIKRPRLRRSTLAGVAVPSISRRSQRASDRLREQSYRPTNRHAPRDALGAADPWSPPLGATYSPGDEEGEPNRRQ
jgi:hypothetical protein